MNDRDEKQGLTRAIIRLLRAARKTAENNSPEAIKELKAAIEFTDNFLMEAERK